MLQHSSRPDNPGSSGEVRRPSLGIVGAGRVGQTLAQTLWTRGYTVTAVYSRSTASAIWLAEQVSARAVESAAEVAQNAQVTLLTVPDEAISAVCEQVALADLTGRAVVHTSGVTPISALISAKRRGALIGGLHPLLPVARAGQPFPPGVTFSIEADREPLRGWLAGMVDALDGVALWLRPGLDRARYHAAAVLISNYLVTLFAEADALLSPFTADEQVARNALLALARATLENIAQVGSTAALTGPIARGDAATVRLHLDGLRRSDPELAEIYRLLGRRTARLAAARGLDADKLKRLQEVLQNHANNDSRLAEDEAQRAAHPNGDRL